MIRRVLATTAAVITGIAVLTSCTGDRRTPGTASPAPSSSAELPNSGAPKVDNPLPAKVLEGSPCDSALTEQQLTDYLGQPGTAKPKDSELGPMCDWASTSGSGAGILVAYETKTGQGLSLTYKVEKPKASRWVDDLAPVQGYPAVGYVDVGAGGQRSCVIVVGVADDLAYSVSLVLGSDSGKDACQLGRGVADTVLTNLKARA
ncbi:MULTISPECIES: DUF3558 domain-containing protein [Amycolatopsis]|uniref:DUF3558 domain-containing protein n=1 Tax=Amycolatopsis bullii TaxID=941987 RepID=A0ABQ3KU14_9PSEU|nr:DUF3558 domain-containing protein [Amycolatopsis bullii]GHG43360.1 hypothetical protein GCM10017567_76830 [Amycolatopsis bullii]